MASRDGRRQQTASITMAVSVAPGLGPAVAFRGLVAQQRPAVRNGFPQTQRRGCNFVMGNASASPRAANLVSVRTSAPRPHATAANMRCAAAADVSLPGSEANFVLVGDIGGTNARLQIWEVTDTDSTSLAFEKIYPTKDFASFYDVMDQMHSENEGTTITTACIAVAGPVVDQVCQMTNLGWVIDGPELTKRYSYKVGVLNDFEAVGYGVRFVSEDNILTLNDVEAVPEAPIAVLGPGTGLGEAQLMWDDLQQAYRVYPSEGSHADFAPRGWKQRALATYLEQRDGFCEIESVGCGSGLENIYEFLVKDEHPHSEFLMEQLTTSLEGNKEFEPQAKSAPEISKSALNREDPIAVEAVDMMLSIVGQEAGHMALRSLARGGVYIAGGITPKVIDRVNVGGLLEAFIGRKGRFSSLLETVPLKVVLDEKVGLLGSKVYSLQLLKNTLAEH